MSRWTWCPKHETDHLTRDSHGMHRTYASHGCRCVPCKEDHARHNYEWRHAHTIRIPKHVHGTLGGYTNWNCRCPKCSEARAAYDALHARRKR